MKKNNLTFISLVAVSFLALVFTACPIDINCKVNNNETVFVSFSTQMGNELINFMKSFENADSTTTPGMSIFNPDEIKQSLIKSGLTDVNVSTPNEKSLKMSFTTKAKIEGNEISITAKDLQDLYNSFDKKTKTYCDLLVAPALINEPMSLEEYSEILSSVYGQKLADEILTGDINFSVEQNGKKTNTSIPIVKFLLLNENEKITVKIR